MKATHGSGQRLTAAETVPGSWALSCFGLEFHSPVAGKIRRHINVGGVRLKSFGCDLQLESAKARVWELKESVLVGFRGVCGTRTRWVVLLEEDRKVAFLDFAKCDFTRHRCIAV